MIRELLEQEPGVIVQGITGRQGQLETEWMISSGTRVVAGVTPGRGGETVHGVPVFDSMEEAARYSRSRISISYAPPFGVSDSIVEAARAGIRLQLVSAENPPLHGVRRALETADAHGMTVIGPNTQGVVVPGVARLGCPGGDEPWERFAPGAVGVVSRSGGIASEISMLLKTIGLGTSIQVSTGGGGQVGLGLAKAGAMVAEDVRTRVLVAFGEASGVHEYELASAFRSGGIEVPVVALVAGRAAEQLPAELPFGHATASAAANESAVKKAAALEEAGIRTVTSMRGLCEAVLEILEA